jgi:hypothetical protein
MWLVDSFVDIIDKQSSLGGQEIEKEWLEKIIKINDLGCFRGYKK